MNQNEVNKSILAKPVVAHPAHELLGPFGRYRDENRAIYEHKRRHLLLAGTDCKLQNEEALFRCRAKLEMQPYRVLSYAFEEEDDKAADPQPTCCGEGVVLHERSERPIHQIIEPIARPYGIESWFTRHLVLHKFVRAARVVVLKNRLLKRLEMLKGLDPETVAELEKSHRKCENMTYEQLFQKFLQ